MSALPVVSDPLEAWVDRLRGQDMPIFSATLAAIGEVAENDASPASALGRIILRDAGMTARVLRMANSVYFRDGKQRIATISRAIVVLGFDTVRGIAVSVALIDAFLVGGLRERVADEMARCFHGAVHARRAAVIRGDASPEEVFISTLLSHIGEMAFWCFSGETGQRLDRALRASREAPELVEAEVLGFRLRALTQTLAREWSLPPLSVAARADRVRADSREALVVAGYRLAEAAEGGWESERARQAVRDYARVLKQNVAEVAPLVAADAREAARIAALYGCNDAAARIPEPSPAFEKVVEKVAEDVAEDVPAGDAEPDAPRQLDIARRMVAQIAQRTGEGAVLDLALEGAARTLGADRAVLARVSVSRAQLAARSADGPGAQLLLQHFNFLLAGASRDALTELVESGRIIDAPAGQASVPGQPSLARLRGVLGERHLMLAPIPVNDQVAGVLCIDRAASRPGFPAGTLDGLQHFARLAGMALERA